MQCLATKGEQTPKVERDLGRSGTCTPLYMHERQDLREAYCDRGPPRNIAGAKVLGCHQACNDIYIGLHATVWLMQARGAAKQRKNKRHLPDGCDSGISIVDAIPHCTCGMTCQAASKRHTLQPYHLHQQLLTFPTSRLIRGKVT